MNFSNMVEKIHQNNRGVTAIEFALLAGPFFLLLVGGFQLASILVSGQTLDRAIDLTARTLQTGQVVRTGAGINDLRTTICAKVIFVRDCEEDLQLSVRSFPDFASINRNDLYESNGRPIITNNTFQPGLSNEIVVISASISIPVLGGGLFPNTSPEGVLISSSLAFKNE